MHTTTGQLARITLGPVNVPVRILGTRHIAGAAFFDCEVLADRPGGFRRGERELLPVGTANLTVAVSA